MQTMPKMPRQISPAQLCLSFQLQLLVFSITCSSTFSSSNPTCLEPKSSFFANLFILMVFSF